MRIYSKIPIILNFMQSYYFTLETFINRAILYLRCFKISFRIISSHTFPLSLVPLTPPPSLPSPDYFQSIIQDFPYSADILRDNR